MEKAPFIVSSLILRFVSKDIFLPKKLFSVTPNPIVLPEVPAPADAKISPVGFSETVIFNTFLSSSSVTSS